MFCGIMLYAYLISAFEEFSSQGWDFHKTMNYSQAFANNLLRPFIYFESHPENDESFHVEMILFLYLLFCEQVTRLFYLVSDTFFVFTVCLYGDIVSEFLKDLSNWRPQVVHTKKSVLITHYLCKLSILPIIVQFLALLDG